jgi:hypothetical protein
MADRGWLVAYLAEVEPTRSQAQYASPTYRVREHLGLFVVCVPNVYNARLDPTA